MFCFTKAAWILGGAGLMLTLVPSCSGDNGSTGPGSTTEVNSYLQSLPDWSSFSPPVPEEDSTPTGGPTFVSDTVAADSAPGNVLGQYTVRQNVIYACQDLPYSATETPSELVMYSPNPAFLWPGAFIQGASHRDGAGTVLPLVIDERAPIKVSIPGLATGQNFRTVSLVDQGDVAAAVGDMIGNAVEDSLNTGSTTFFRAESYRSEQEFALKIGLSGRYLGWKAKTQASSSTTGSQSLVAVQFKQKMFDVVVAPPSTPGGWFSSAFTRDKLQQQIDLNRIGPNNLPVYVSKVSYGRMMMFTMKANASESELKGIIQASYSALGNGAAASLSARQKNIVNQSQIEIFSMGGADSATAAMIRSGDWRSYFTVSAPLSTAVPLSYEFRTVADNSLADVAETTNYTKRTCQELSQVPGQLQFVGGQGISAPVPAPYEVQLADVSGDGRADLVWNYRSPTANQVAVSLGGANGVFGAPTAYTNSQPTPSEGWSNYDLHVGDVTGDGLADLVWNYRGATANKVYVATALAGGGFTFAPLDSLSGADWTSFKLFLGDVTGDGAKDLVWNALTSINSTYVGASNKDGSFALGGPYIHPLSGWTPYRMFIADLNKDGRADLIWNDVPGQSSPNRTYTALSQDPGGFQFLPSKDHSATCCWTNYQPLVADFNGDQVADIYWNRTNGPPVYLHQFQGNGSGGWTQRAGSSIGDAVDYYAPLTGDLNGDGRADLIWTKLDADSARIRVGLADSDGLPVISPVEQVVPATDNFNIAKVFVTRVDGDTRDDVVWVIPEATTKIYVGLALP